MDTYKYLRLNDYWESGNVPDNLNNSKFQNNKFYYLFIFILF